MNIVTPIGPFAVRRDVTVDGEHPRVVVADIASRPKTQAKIFLVTIGSIAHGKSKANSNSN